MSARLDGRRAYVTGAGRGLGLAIATRLTELGATVALTDLDEAAVRTAAEGIGGGAIGLRADVTSEEDVRASLEEAASRLGGLDIVVNNAGVEIARPIVETESEEFRRLLDINVIGVFHGIKHAVPHLAGDGGVIVNLASVAGLGGSPLLGAYCASKGAVMRLTEVAAIELRDSGIRVCSVCPAFADTEMVERLVEPVQATTGLAFEDIIATKQQRLGTPQDVAEGVAFLVSDEASWMTGQPLILDGGMTGSLL
ncbi:MAG: SDR family oxidoreductase [Solirubrobacterales bacterium]|nr:SDR family oxidoreductase [Solirubrobacterales bacterium]